MGLTGMTRMEIANYNIYISTVGKNVYPLLEKIIGAVYYFVYTRLHLQINEKVYNKIYETIYRSVVAVRKEYTDEDLSINGVKEAASVEDLIVNLFQDLNPEMERCGVSVMVTIVEDIPVTNMQRLHMSRLFEGKLPIKFQKVRHGKRV